MIILIILLPLRKTSRGMLAMSQFSWFFIQTSPSTLRTQMCLQVSKDLAAHHIGVIGLPEQFGKFNIIFYDDPEGFSIGTSHYNMHVVII
jgi:hypothetical protein